MDYLNEQQHVQLVRLNRLSKKLNDLCDDFNLANLKVNVNDATSNNNSDKKSILVNDILECDINELLHATKDLNVVVKYEWINDLELNIDNNVDLTFIDTWHIYGQLKRELNKFSAITNKYIIMHDTTVDAIEGETLRFSLDADAQSKESGIPVEEIKCGLWRAIEEFLDNNKSWKLLERYHNNNGLTILERIN